MRSIFCVYCNDEQEGALHLLNLMERLRIRLLQDVVIGGQFELDLEAGIEVLIYPETQHHISPGKCPLHGKCHL